MRTHKKCKAKFLLSYIPKVKVSNTYKQLIDQIILMVFKPMPLSLFLSITFISIILSGLLSNGISALSPSIIRQQIKDESLDIFSPIAKVVPYGDIRIVNYISDGNRLNATLWLHSSPIKKESPPFDVIELKYGMLIDSDFNQGTGWDGADYEVSVKWSKKINKTTSRLEGVWERDFIEHTLPGVSRILSETNNYSGFFQEGKPYIILSADLGEMSFPNKYRVIFYSQIIKDIRTVDFTSWIDIPPTEHQLSTFPSPVELRQGEQKNFGMQLKSTSGFVPNIVNFASVENNSQIKVEFNPDNIKSPYFGIGPIPSMISVSNNAVIGQYSIPILVQISTKELNFPSIFPNTKIPPTQSTITKILNLTLTIEEPLTFSQRVKDFWDTYGGIISFLGAGFVGGAATYILDYIRIRNKNIDTNK
jgi:hypothetical protein